MYRAGCESIQTIQGWRYERPCASWTKQPMSYDQVRRELGPGQIFPFTSPHLLHLGINIHGCLMPSPHIPTFKTDVRTMQHYRLCILILSPLMSSPGKRNESKLCKLQEQEMPPHGEAPYQSSSTNAASTRSHPDISRQV